MNRRSILLAFLKLFIPLGALFLGGLLWVDQYNRNEMLHVIQTGALRGVSLEGEALSDGLHSNFTNAVMLASMVSHELADHQNQEVKYPHLPSLFNAFIEIRPRYLRAQAFLVDYRATVGAQRNSPGSPPRPATSLGGPVDHALYQRILLLKPGTVAVTSHFRPPPGSPAPDSFIPFWRIVAPIIGQDGRPAGMVVLDLTGFKLLAGIRSRIMGMGNTLYLVDSTGGGILRSEPDSEWSPLVVRADGVAKPSPVWDRVLSQPQGQFRTEQGLFSFKTFQIGPSADLAGGDELTGQALIKLVVQIPTARLTPPTPYFSPWLVIPILVLLASLIWPWAVARTRRQEAERALHENQRTVLAVSRSLRDAVLVVDEADRVQFWNPAAQAMFGYTHQEMKDQTVQLLGRDEQQEVKGIGSLGYQIRALLDQSSEGLQRFTARRKDGGQFPVEVRVSRMYQNGRRFNVGILRDITQRVETERKLVELATTDPLTGLINRRRFMELAREELARSCRYGHHISLLMLDLDHFKSINDTHGHQVGDQVLIELARVSQGCLRQVDVMGRIGGEEFAVLMPETDILQAVVAADRLRRALEFASVKVPEADDDEEVRFTVSIGVAQAVPGEQTALRVLFKQADNAMYRAKESGRNRVQAA